MTSWQTRFNRLMVYTLCWTINVQPVLANVVVSNSNTQVSQAANGVEVVNIAAPNSKGLSHNQYEMFNVDESGLILNNATQALTKSQLAGFVEGNANLKGRAASIILNEVTGSNRSQLNGYTEVLGKQANVILANPYGITCDGCGFINTPRVTLSTGTPQINDGRLSGFDVSQGNISIEGLGLDGSNQTYFDIITRAAKVSADIHAKDLTVVAGDNQVDYQTNHVTQQNTTGAVTPEVAIDAAALGGMYAGRIQLISTDSGVGVNVGNLAASAGNIQISADGQITLGNASATQDISVNTAQQLTLAGQQYAGNDFNAQANSIAVTNATLAAQSELSLSAQQDIQIAQSSVNAGLDSDGTITQQGKLNVSAQSLRLDDAQVVSSDELTTNVSQVSLNETSQIQATQAELTSLSSLTNQGEIQVAQQVAFSGNAYQLAGDGSISAQRISLTGGAADINAQLQGSNISSQLYSLAVGEQGHLNASQALDLTAQSLTNQGVLQSAKNIDLTGTDVTNQGSLIAGNNIQVSATQDVTNSGLLYSGQDTRFNVAGDVVNQQGDMLIGGNFVSQGMTDGERSNGFYNRSGNIEAQGNIRLNADTIENTRVTAEETTASISNSAPSKISKKLTLKSRTCKTRGGNEAGENCTSTYYGFSEQRIMSQDSTVATIEGEASQLKSGGNLDIDTGVLRNNASLITSNGDIAITADKVSNKAFQTVKNTVYANYSSGESSIQTVKVKRKLSTETEQGELYNASMIANGDIIITASDSVDNGTTQANAQGSDLALPGAPVVTLPDDQADNAFISDNDVAFPNYTIPESPNGLFVPSTDPQSHYVIETNPLLTDIGNFIGSDYFLDKLDYEPEQDIKFLGDAYYDTRTITQTIFEQTGQRYLNDEVGSDLAQMQALMDAAAQAQSELDLQVGVALTSEQIANLSQDIIWYEKITVDGQEVLAPKLYLASATEQSLAQGGALISGNDIEIAANTITNQNGAITAEGDIDLSAQDSITNQNGAIDAQGDVSLAAQNDIANIGASISGNAVSLVSTEGNVLNQTQVETLSVDAGGNLVKNSPASNASDVLTNVGSTASITARNTLNIEAGKDINIDAANLAAQGDIALNAGGSINVSAARNQTTDFQTDGNIQQTTSVVTNMASNISANGNLVMTAQQDINAAGSNFAALGNLALSAGQDVSFTTAVDELSQTLTKRGHKESSSSVTHQGVGFSADNISIAAGGDLAMTSAKLEAQQGVSLAADGDVSLLAANDSTYSYDKTTKKKSFGRKKTTINESLTESVNATEIAASNITISAGTDSDGQASDLTLVGAKLSADSSVNLAADGDVVLAAQSYREYERHETRKSGFGGLTSKNTGSIDDATLLGSANVITGADVSIQSGNDIGVIASNISAGGLVDLEAENQVVVGADYAQHSSQQWSEESSLLSGGDIYSMSSHREGVTSSTAQGSQIQSGSDLNISGGDVTLVGSTLATNGSANLSSQSGDIQVLAAENQTSSYSNDEQMSIGFGDVANAGNIASLALGNVTALLSDWDSVKQSLKGEQFNTTIAQASYDKVDSQTQSTTHQGSSINSAGNVVLNSDKNITVEGSNIIADAEDDNEGSIALVSGGDVAIRETIDTVATTADETHATADISLNIKHEAVESVHAAEALKQSKDALQQAENSYEDYKDQLASLEDKLQQLKDDYQNNVAGVELDDIEELKDLIDDSKSDEAWYLTTISLASADVVSKSTMLLKQTATLANSASTYGFNAGLTATVTGSKTQNSSQQSQSNGSTLSGQNISINAGGNTESSTAEVRGSSLIADNSLDISADNINLTASQSDTSSHSNTQSGTLSASISLHDTSGVNFNGSLNNNQSSSDSVTNTNTQLNAAQISLSSSQDTRIEGANVAASESLAVDVGGDLTVASMQDSNNSTSQGAGVTASLSTDLNFNSTGGSGGVNASNNKTRSKQTALTTLTSQGDATINVANNTEITGAMIATLDGQGEDLGQLSLKTGMLTYTNLSDTEYSKNQNNGFSGVGGETLSLQLQNNSSYSKTKTLATLGQGNLDITDSDSSSDLSQLNRDVENTSKDLFSVEREQGNADVTIDTRLFSEAGRADIAEDIKRNQIAGEVIAETISKESIGLLSDSEEGVTSSLDHLVAKQGFFTATKNFITNDKNQELIETLNDPTASAEDKKAAYQGLSASLSEQFGITPAEAMIALTETVSGQQSKGAYLDGQIFVNDFANATLQDVVKTIGHETQHYIDDMTSSSSNTESSTEFKTNRDEYAEVMGNSTEDYYSFNYENQGLGTFGGFNLHRGTATSSVVAEDTAQFSLIKNDPNLEFRLPTGDEFNAISKLSGGDAELEQQLKEAACALTKCSAQYAVGSTQYNEMKALEEAGADKTDAQEALLNYSFMKVSSVLNMATLEDGFFEYSDEDLQEDIRISGKKTGIHNISDAFYDQYGIQLDEGRIEQFAEIASALTTVVTAILGASATKGKKVSGINAAEEWAAYGKLVKAGDTKVAVSDFNKTDSSSTIVNGSEVANSGTKLLTYSSKIRFFKGDEAVLHFERHSSELMQAFGRSSYNLKNYLDDANYVIKNGTFVPEMNGYVRLIGGKGSAKYGFVGLDRASGNITTFHVKSVSELAKKAPSLGFSK